MSGRLLHPLVRFAHFSSVDAVIWDIFVIFAICLNLMERAI